MSILKMSLRNVGRNRRRSLVTIAAMTLATFVMLVYGTLMTGILVSMERNAVIMDTGQVQIHKPGYLEDPDLYGLIDNSDDILSKLNKQGLDAAPRLYGFGLGASGSSSAGVSLRGVDIEREAHVTKLHDHIREGQWLDAKDPQGVVLGHSLAHSLGAKIGSEIIVLSQASDGSMANDLFKVRGILNSVNESINRGGLLMPAATFRELMVVPNGAHEIAVMGEDLTDLDALATRIQSAAPKQEVKHWKALQPLLANLLETSKGSMIFMSILTYLAIAMVVFNAMLMSVFERIREFGVLKAVGMPPRRLAMMIFGEATVQVLIAGILATALGLPTALWLQERGIDLRSFTNDMSFGGIAMEPIWYTHVTTEAVIQPIAVMLLMTGLAVIWPALKAALIKPIEAFRHN